MLRGWNGNQQKRASRSWNLLIFSVGGRKLAVKTEELAGVSEWTGGIPIASRTPFISSIVRLGQDVFPVFDLAEMLAVSVRGESLLCVTAKHPRGTLAICVDADMPILHTLDVATVQPYSGETVPSVGSFLCELDNIPILSVSQLGMAQER
ncbi:MAG: chemotaxis protein CheW [Nitrospira sp.]|nr:chemotaxis protein CheW [Nitrospira sp.]